MNGQQRFRLNKINEFKDYFVAKIKGTESVIKKLSNYIASFDYFYKSLMVLSVITASISVASFATDIGAPAGIVSSSFSLSFSIFTRIVKNGQKQQEIKRKSIDEVKLLLNHQYKTTYLIV